MVVSKCFKHPNIFISKNDLYFQFGITTNPQLLVSTTIRGKFSTDDEDDPNLRHLEDDIFPQLEGKRGQLGLKKMTGETKMPGG